MKKAGEKMSTLTIDHKNGHKTTYQLINAEKSMPIAYHEQTSKEVIAAIRTGKSKQDKGKDILRRHQYRQMLE